MKLYDNQYVKLLACNVIMLSMSMSLDAGIWFKGSSSFLQVQAGGRLTIDNTISNVNGSIIKEAGAIISGGAINFIEGILEDSETDIALSGITYNPLGTLILPGNSELSCSGGQIVESLNMYGSNNLISGQLILQSPMVLRDLNTTVSMAVQSAMNQNILMNGGSIYLQDDLHFADGMAFTGSGSINLNGYAIYLGGQDFTWTGTTLWYDAANVAFNGSVNLSGMWTFSDYCIIDGRSNTLDLSAGGQIKVNSGSTLVIKNMRLLGVQGSNIQCVDNTSTIILDDVTWIQSGNYQFNKGTLSFINNILFSGAYTFTYASPQTSIINDNSSWIITNGMTLSIGKQSATTTVQPLNFVDNSSILEIDGATILVDQYGMQMTYGTLIFDGNSVLDIVGTVTQYGFILGDGVSGHDATMVFNSGASMSFVNGYFVYNDFGQNGVQATSKTATVIRSGASLTYVQTDWTLPSWTLAVLPNQVPTTILAPGVIFGYDNTNLVFSTVEMDITAHQTGSIDFAMFGNDSLYFTKGVFGLPLLVQNTGTNEITGTADINGPITLENSSATVAFDLQGQILTDITMNGGSIVLNGTLALGAGAIFTGTGIVDMTSNAINLGTTDCFWTSTLTWQGSNASILLNSVVELSGTWTISGSCIINGNGNTLDLGTTGQIVVDSNSSLIFRNIHLKNISGSAISCIDDTGSITLDVVAWVQSGNTTFNFGSIEFLNYVDFTGSYTFFYESSQTSTIASETTWHIHDFMTVSMGRSTPTTLIEPLYFIDNSSIVNLNNTYLQITQNGYNFINGTLLCDRNVSINMLSTSTANGLTFGNGMSANDPVLQLSPGAYLYFAGGHLVYDVTSSTNLMCNSTSSILGRSPTSVFYVQQSLTLPVVTIAASPTAMLTMAPGTTLYYNNCLVTTNEVEFSLLGARYNVTTSLLSGNGSLFLTRGILPLATLIEGTGNSILGNGSISGPITLSNAASQCTLGLDGIMFANISLNGGTMALAQNLELAAGAIITTTGLVELSAFQLTIASDSSWTSTIYLSCLNSMIQLEGLVELSGTWTVGGTCIINGNGNTIDLSQGGNIAVDVGSQLTLRDVRLTGVSGNNIQCLSNTSTIILDNVTWVQDNSFTFSTGSLQWRDSVQMVGQYNFVYRSNNVSVIQSESTLLLDSGITFSYDPLSGANNLLNFTNQTSILVLDGANLYVTAGGLTLTNGQLQVTRDSDISCDSTSSTGSISIGNGVSNSDMICEILNSVKLNFTHGSLNYYNVNLSSWLMSNNNSLLVMYPGTALNLYKSLNTGDGIVIFESDTVLGRAPGADIDGSIYTFGSLTYATV